MIGRKGAGKKRLRENISSGSSCSLEKKEGKGRSRKQSFSDRRRQEKRRAGALLSALFLVCMTGVFGLGSFFSNPALLGLQTPEPISAEEEKENLAQAPQRRARMQEEEPGAIQDDMETGMKTEPLPENPAIYLNDTFAGLTDSQLNRLGVFGTPQEEPEIGQVENDLTTANGFETRDDQVVVQGDGVNLRAESQTESRIIVQLKTGDTLQRTGENGEWSRVVYEGTECYVSNQFVAVKQPEPEPDSPAGVRAAAASEDDGLVRAASEGEIQPIGQGPVVVIDAGHQNKENIRKEPAGPESSRMSQKMEAGAVGSFLGIRECDVTLAIAEKTKQVLTERGYQVIMTRESNDVNMSWAERARLAEKSGADALIHIHAHSQESTSVTGVLASCQSSGNPYNGDLASESYALSSCIAGSVSQAAGAKNRGVKQTDTSSEINWSQVPVTALETGFLSNQQEELLLSQEEYQSRIAVGIADGLDQFFAGRR